MGSEVFVPSEESEGLRKVAGVGEAWSVIPHPEKQEDLEGNSLACSGVGETWFPPQLRDKHRGEFLILQTFEYQRKTWTKGNFRILSYRSSGYERSSRGCLGNLMERDKGGQEIGRQQKDMRHESLKPGF